ncbi:DUF1206 domain-containing protein [Nocardioides sp. GXQ0305]|uniref:DUF1206 domain-containing protein n=1 Tax=Nocardioides sp. GXQ0305 TaxID=3423912 RepID=UPI003D7ED832
MGEIQNTAQRARNSDVVDHAVRPGLVAYGLVHLVVGWLALQLAFGGGAGSASSTGAVRALARQPFGEVLVWLVALGMMLLVLWQLWEAVAGHRGLDDRTRLRKRLASVGKTLVYGYIGVTAISIATGSGSSGGGTDSMTAKVMALPGGQLLVGLTGAVIIGVGGYLVWKGLSEKFREDLTAQGESGDTGTAVVLLGKAGYAAKGTALGVVGLLFGYAAVTHDARKSGGLDQALQEVLDQPFGPYVLGAVAVGIGCFGLFCFAHARYLSR